MRNLSERLHSPVKSFAVLMKVPLGYIPSELSAVLKCRSIDLCHVCVEENKQDGRLKDRLMLRGLMTKLRGNSDSRRFVAEG